MPEESTYRLLSDTGAILESMPLDENTAGSVASQLESVTYDLALAIIRWEEERGSTPESRMARTVLAGIDERLLAIQRNLRDMDMGETREELKAARLGTLDLIALLGREGVHLVEMRPEQQNTTPSQDRWSRRSI